MELELASFDHFVDNLEPDNKETLKMELTTKLFGAKDIDMEISEMKKHKSKEGITVENFLELLEKCGIKKEGILDYLKNIITK